MAAKHSIHAQSLHQRLLPAVESAGYELVALEYSKKGNTLRMLIDHLVDVNVPAQNDPKAPPASDELADSEPLPEAVVQAANECDGGGDEAGDNAKAIAAAAAREELETQRAIRAAGMESAARSGIRLTDCQVVSRLVEGILDGEGLMPEGAEYHLEVSSPGVERPLVRPRDYVRFVGQPARIKLRTPLAGNSARTLDGKLVHATDMGITLEVEGASLSISFDAIERARLRLP